MEMFREPLLVARAFSYRFHYVIKVEAAGLLARREIAEALQPFADISAGGREHEHVIHPPSVVADAFMLGPLERIHTQIGQHRRTQYLEWLSPDVNSFGVLFQECDLPVVVAQRSDVTVVGPIEKIMARPLGLSLERGQQIVAIEARPPGPHPREQARARPHPPASPGREP